MWKGMNQKTAYIKSAFQITANTWKWNGLDETCVQHNTLVCHESMNQNFLEMICISISSPAMNAPLFAMCYWKCEYHEGGV
jgi:hypothetical protein